MKHPMSLLIVDDHAGMRASLSDILEEDGYNIQAAADGREAIGVCSRDHVDLVLMDVRMPGMSGIDAFRQIKKLSRSTQVILMSAYSVEATRQEAVKEGALAFLQKPLDLDRVLELVRQTGRPPALLVMDPDSERDKLSERLIREAYRTYVCDVPEEAIELAEQVGFKLIIIDADLKRANPMDVYMRLCVALPEAVAIIATGETTLREVQDAMGSKLDCMTKPVNTEKLSRALTRIKDQKEDDVDE
jgi:DNA-binding NtrC family response regulator